MTCIISTDTMIQGTAHGNMKFSSKICLTNIRKYFIIHRLFNTGWIHFDHSFDCKKDRKPIIELNSMRWLYSYRFHPRNFDIVSIIYHNLLFCTKYLYCIDGDRSSEIVRRICLAIQPGSVTENRFPFLIKDISTVHHDLYQDEFLLRLKFEKSFLSNVQKYKI